MDVVTSFLERNEGVFKQHGHLLEGIKHYSDLPRNNNLEENKMLVILDNLVKAFCYESKGRYQNYKEIYEASMTRSPDAVAFIKTAFPLVRNVFANMITREFISVQPISQPDAKVFYYDILRDDGTKVSDDVHNRRDYGTNVEYNPSAPTAIKLITPRVTGETVSATSIKLKEKHTLEAQQDFMAYHGLSIVDEMNFHLQQEVTLEWDRIILQDMIDEASGGSAIFDQTLPVGLSYEDRKYWMETFYEAWVDVDTQIFIKRRKKTNFAVFPAAIAGFVEKMAGFKADPVSPDQKIILTGGRYFMGTMDARWRCYADPFLPADKVLVGYNSPGSWLDTAYVFAPYIMSYFTPEFIDPETQVACRSILSRSAKKMVVPDLVGTISIVGS